MDFATNVADRISASSARLATQWFEELRALLPTEAIDVFPTTGILDHIPELIREIAGLVARPEGIAAGADTALLAKARELGELRFAQQASVHQLLREYRLLGGVLATFVRDECDAGHLIAVHEAVDVVARLHDAVFVLLETTVDTFVSRYTRRIDEQRARLESFNRMMGHELRQPLGAVRTGVELLKADEVWQDDGQRVSVLGIVARNVMRMADLTRTLGVLAQPSLDNPTLQDADVSQVAAQIAGQLSDMAEARSVRITTPANPVRIEVDIARLELILMNLVSNAIKYADPDKSDRFVEVAAEVADALCTIVVRDNGIGVPASVQPRIFESGFRGHTGRDGELAVDGAGLGLSIVAECLQGLDATIAMESAEGEGTAFTVTLPVRAADIRRSRTSASPDHTDR